MTAPLTQTSPDGRVVVTAQRIGTKTTPYLRVTIDGALAASEECRLHSGRARVALLDSIPAEHVAWVGGALVLLADAWVSAMPGSPAAAAAAESAARLTRDDDPWPSPVNAREVLDLLREMIARHVALPAHGDVVLTLWIAHTWFVDALGTTAYLWLTSPLRACGKSSVLDLCELLCRRAWKVSNPSGAAIFRTIEKERPTLLLDEIDTLQGPKLDDLVAILNDGFSANGRVPRCVGDGHDVQTFSVFSCKAFAGIGTTLPDATRSRCIRLPMARATPAELSGLVRLRTDRAERWAAPLRASLARLAADHLEDMRAAMRDEDAVAIPAGVSGRDAQAWEPLLFVADLAGDAWSARARAACDALVAQRQADDDGDPKVRLLRDLRTYYREKGDETATSDQLITWLCEDEARGWCEWGRQRKPITPHALAALLRPFKLAPVRVGRATTSARVWMRASFAPVWAQYLEAEGTPDAAARAFQDSSTGNAPVAVVPQAPPSLFGEDDWAGVLADGPPLDDDPAALIAAD
jgi:putative DNA primase/helicase